MTSASMAEEITMRIAQAVELYHRLIIVVAPAGAGKTAALQVVHEHTAAPLINVNLELSRRMLGLTERQRPLHLPRLLSEILSAIESDVVLFDNIEILFDISLKQDPLRLLQGLSRLKTVVTTWNGMLVDGHIVYGEPGHPEYRSYTCKNFLIVSPEVTV